MVISTQLLWISDGKIKDYLEGFNSLWGKYLHSWQVLSTIIYNSLTPWLHTMLLSADVSRSEQCCQGQVEDRGGGLAPHLHRLQLPHHGRAVDNHHRYSGLPHHHHHWCHLQIRGTCILWTTLVIQGKQVPIFCSRLSFQQWQSAT